MEPRLLAKDEPNLGIGYFFAAAGAILFSIKAIIVKLAYEIDVDPETLLALRLGLSLPFYLAVGFYSISGRRQKLAALPSLSLTLRAAAIGVLGMWVASYADFLGLQYIGAQFERLILATYPFFVVLFGALFFRQEVRRRGVIALAISYVGLALIFGENLSLEGRDIVLGAGLVFIAAIAFALYQLFAKDAMAEMGPRLFTCIAMVGATLAGFAQFFIGHDLGDLVVSRMAFIYGLIIAVGATVLPTFFLNAALHRIPAQDNATIAIMGPVATIVLAAIILGERMSAISIAGTVLVIAGIAWFSLSDRRG
ncbi:MAG: DMT family transporter [Alphaproteobacteria bacterium]|nr:DMT family transporter [Alphaproteobacteria bacterium]